MRKILKEGKINKLLSDSGIAGWSGEVHLVKHKGKKYVLRKCEKLQKAKHYEEISKKLEKYNILPRFLGRAGKNVFYEYIEGRDLKEKESANVIRQIGEISAYINKIKAGGKISKRFNNQLKELVSGDFEGVKKRKALLSGEKAIKIKKIYNYLNKKTKPEMRWDINDINPDNFRLRKGKVYFVDVEAIRLRIRLYGLGKCFIKWFKTQRQRNYFKQGYGSVSSIKFLTQEYEDFIYLNFIIQEINYMCKYSRKYKPRRKMRFEELNLLIKKYEKIK